MRNFKIGQITYTQTPSLEQCMTIAKISFHCMLKHSLLRKDKNLTFYKNTNHQLKN